MLIKKLNHIYFVLVIVISFTNVVADTYYEKIGKQENGFYSQCSQDRFIFETFFKYKKAGTFIDIGAHNGIAFSNTKFFEEQGWKGICIEPIPEVFRELEKNRNCICIQGCITDYEGVGQFLRVGGEPEMLSGLINNYDLRHLNRIRDEASRRTFGEEPQIINVQCYLLNSILEKNGIFHIDYLSIDTEGNELEILKSIDFNRFLIDVIDVENNFGETTTREFLKSKGYRFYTNVAHDDIFVRDAMNIYINK